MKSATAVKAIIIENGKVLVIKRREDDVHRPGHWDIPGGRLDEGEGLSAGLRREVSEETNLLITIHELLGKQYFSRDDKQNISMHIFHCTPHSGTVTLSEEHTAFKWVSLSEAKRLLAYYDKELDICTTLS